MGKTILLIDDDEHLLVTLADALAFEGYKVLRTHDGGRALEIVDENTPDLILLDVMMPVRTEAPSPRRSAKGSTVAASQIVFLTAVPESEMVDRASLRRLRPFISKLISPEEVLDRIKEYLV